MPDLDKKGWIKIILQAYLQNVSIQGRFILWKLKNLNFEGAKLIIIQPKIQISGALDLQCHKKPENTLMK